MQEFECTASFVENLDYLQQLKLCQFWLLIQRNILEFHEDELQLSLLPLLD